MRKFVVIRRVLLGISTSLSFISHAQTRDTIQSPKLQNYPLERPFILQYDRMNNAEYTNRDRDGQILHEGKAQVTRFKAFGAFKVYQKKKFTLSASALYSHENITNYEYKDAENKLSKSTFNVDDVDLAVNGTYMSTLWNIPIIYSGSVIMSSPNLIDVKRVSAIASSSLIFVKGPQTRYTLGLVLLLDPSVVTPVLPIVTYWHRFNNPLWEVDVVLPQKVIVRRADFLEGWLTIGSELYGNGFFASASTGLPSNYEYRFADIYSGIGYERLIGKFLIGARTGFRSTLQGRMLKVYNRNSDYLFETKTNTVPYFNLNVALAIPYIFKRNK